MAMIATTYGADGTKVRRPVGYTGGQCNVATKPYEAAEMQGQTKKTTTSDFYLPEPQVVPVDERTKIGGN